MERVVFVRNLERGVYSCVEMLGLKGWRVDGETRSKPINAVGARARLDPAPTKVGLVLESPEQPSPLANSAILQSSRTVLFSYKD
jgi:hypothetical protein